MFEKREYPEKSWSVSKMDTFESCKRKYYYSTYAQWNGWESDASELSKKAYTLNKLGNVYSSLGTYLHRMIKNNILGMDMDSKTIYSNILNSIKEDCKSSFYKKEEWLKSPKSINMLHEYYYGNGLNKELGKKIAQRVMVCSENVFKSKTYNELKDTKSKIYELDEETFNFFKYKGTKLYAILDALYKIDDKIVIADWKTGKKDSQKHDIQMIIYVMYVLSEYKGINIEKIECVNEYLLTGESYVRTFTYDEIKNVQRYIDSSIEKIEEYLEDSELNKPKPLEYFKANPGYACKMCNFIEICEEGKKYLKK